MNVNEQEAKLRDEIIADAKNKADRIIARAKVDADDVIAKAHDEAVRKHQEHLAEAQTLAEDKTKSMLGDIDMEISRRWLRRQEQCIDELLQAALADCLNASGEARLQSLQALAAEAIEAIGEEVACEVRFKPSDVALVKELFEGKAQYSLCPDNSVEGGLVLIASDGTKTFDNTYRKRLERMRDDLRCLVVED